MSYTLIIIIVTVVSSISAWNRPGIYYGWMFNPYQISHKGQFYRFLSSGFIHDGWIHLGFNMFTFYFFGRNVEQIYTYVLGPSGPTVFVVMYLSAIVLSDLPNFFKYKDFQGKLLCINPIFGLLLWICNRFYTRSCSNINPNC